MTYNYECLTKAQNGLGRKEKTLVSVEIKPDTLDLGKYLQMFKNLSYYGKELH